MIEKATCSLSTSGAAMIVRAPDKPLELLSFKSNDRVCACSWFDPGSD